MKIPMMSAVRFDGSGVRVEEVRRVRPATGQVLVRVTAVALDRSDGEPRTGPRPVLLNPAGRRTLGRHAAGTVAGIGVGVDGWPLGLPVVIRPEVWARRSSFLPGVEHDGSLADYLVAPADALVPLPDGLSPAEGARLPLAARAFSILTHARVVPGESVGVWGAGALGGAALAVARALGAAPVVAVEPDEVARATTPDRGADASLDPAVDDVPAVVRRLTGRRGLDVALHAACDPAAAGQALAALGPEGRLVLAGPAPGIGGVDRWDGRTLSGVPRMDPDALPRVAHLADQRRLHLLETPPLPGGLPAAAGLLDAAVRGGPVVAPQVLSL